MSQLEFIVGNKVIPFPAERFLIGTATECQVRVSGADVKPKHAEVMKESDGTWWVRDISGSGSVRVDGARTWEGQLQSGSFLSVGAADLAVREAGADGFSSTVKTKSGPHKSGEVKKPPEADLGFAGTVMTKSGAHPSGETPMPLGAEPVEPTVMRDRPEEGTRNARPSGPRPAPPPKKKGQFEPGDVIDTRYRIIDRIAQGGMGAVYKAEHIELHKPVAMKVMLPDLSKDAEFVARFKREAIASSRIGQQNIVDISDFGRTGDGMFYFVMELLDGRTLSSHIKEGAMPLRRAAHVMVQIGRALMAAHDAGIVHRDLKPENVMILQRPGQPDFVKVLDFGIAKVNEGHGAGGLTQIGMVVGTPQYMSPEQASGFQVDHRSDIYSLGLIFYEVMAGRPTFEGETPSILMAKQMTAEPAPLGSGPIELPVPVALDELIFHMLQKKPADRPQSMHEVVDRLDPFLSPSSSRNPTASMTQNASGSVPIVLTPLPPGSTQQEMPARGATPKGMPSISISAATPMPQPTLTAPASGGKIALMFGGAFVLALLLGIGVAGYVGMFESKPIVVVPLPPAKKEREPPPVANEPAGPGKLTLKFDTKPSGAEVYEDDVLLGTAPVTVSRESGKVIALKFQLRGYRPLTRKVRFEEGQQALTIELDKEQVKEPREPKKGGADAPKGTKPAAPLHDDPYSNVKELKDLPD